MKSASESNSNSVREIRLIGGPDHGWTQHESTSSKAPDVVTVHVVQGKNGRDLLILYRYVRSENRTNEFWFSPMESVVLNAHSHPDQLINIAQRMAKAGMRIDWGRGEKKP